MAITVKIMKLVRKIPWNSLASFSVSPDIEAPGLLKSLGMESTLR